MNPPIITKITSRKRIRSLHGDRDTLAFAECVDMKTKQHIITIPYRASTKTRLHEIAHCELGHCVRTHQAKNITIDEFMEMEIEAEEYAYSKCGKTISLEAVLDQAHSLITDFRRKPNYVFTASVKALARYGYNLTKEQRSELWTNCMIFKKELKNDTQQC